MVPEHFETSRLRFRKLTSADTTPLMEYFDDPVANEFLFIPEPTETFAKNWVARQQRRYQSTSGGLLAVELKESGELIGQSGLILQFVDGIPKIEISYHFIPRFWGKGYATEAAMALRDLAFETELAETLISLIHPDNLRSQGVAFRNGMKEWKRTIWRGQQYIVFRITRTQWEAMKGF
jgi:RimJ/RimL family protein N-acetyltransferase